MRTMQRRTSFSSPRKSHVACRGGLLPQFTTSSHQGHCTPYTARSRRRGYVDTWQFHLKNATSVSSYVLRVTSSTRLSRNSASPLSASPPRYPRPSTEHLVPSSHTLPAPAPTLRPATHRESSRRVPASTRAAPSEDEGLTTLPSAATRAPDPRLRPRSQLLAHDHSSCTSRPWLVIVLRYSLACAGASLPCVLRISASTATTSRPMPVPPHK